ncbi:MAG TPA: c-type cytochrome [Vicinamibacterales bacterium]|nr:c-type cytochrome [Vicinamibacterales bacterium]
MRRSWMLIVPAVVVWLLAFVTVGRADVRAAQGRGGWNIPATARTEKSPLTVDDKVLADGKKLFSSKCQRCHGASGKGDGPDGDPAHADDMNLTNPARAQQNPDGVVFYKIWNGRSSPKMPTFSEEISKEQAWTIVAYVQTLRAK